MLRHAFRLQVRMIIVGNINFQRTADVVEPACHKEAIEVAHESPAAFGAWINHWKTHLSRRVPTNIGPPKRKAGNIEAAIQRHFERNSCCISSDQQPLATRRTVLEGRQPDICYGS